MYGVVGTVTGAPPRVRLAYWHVSAPSKTGIRLAGQPVSDVTSACTARSYLDGRVPLGEDAEVQKKGGVMATSVDALPIDDQLAQAFRGVLVGPDDAGFDDARMVWNGMFDRRPRLIARCSGAADVIAAVNFARENELTVAVRGGGHSASGLRDLRRRARDRPLADERDPRRSRGARPCAPRPA